MDKLKARKILQKNSLINRSISKKIINSIAKNCEYNVKFASIISKKSYDQVKIKFKEKKNFLKNKNVKISPRNLPFYYIIKSKIPDFTWKIKDNPKAKHLPINVELFRPKIEGLEVSLSSLIFDIVKINDFNSKFDKEYVKLFKNVNFANQKTQVYNTLLELLNSINNSRKINILSPICPDYGNVELGKGLYRFTFDNLGNDIGVTAKRLLENLKNLQSFFNNLGFKFTHYAPIGDFEALSEENLKRVDLNYNQFIENLSISQKKLNKASGGHLKTPFFTELCGGIEKWKNKHKYFHEMLKNNDYGFSNLNNEKIQTICEARKPLLLRWFGEISSKKITNVVKFQGAEYATMGYFIEKKFKNSIIIGTDHYKMSPFYNVGTNLPILYLTSNYMRNENGKI